MPDAIWTRYEVRWQFTGRLCGSVPQRAELIKAWLDARAPERIPAAVAAGEAPTLADLEQEVIATLPDQPETDAEMVERITLGFQQNAAGLFVRGGTVKAHLKDCANQLQKPLDFKNLRLIALVQDDSSKQILQAKQVEIAGNGKAGEAAE